MNVNYQGGTEMKVEKPGMHWKGYERELEAN